MGAGNTSLKKLKNPNHSDIVGEDAHKSPKKVPSVNFNVQSLIVVDGEDEQKVPKIVS